MSKKKTTTKPKEKATRQSAATAHEQEFAETIMAPKFWVLLTDHDFDLTYTTLTTVYNNAYGTRLSTSTVKKYLDLLGWKYERKPTWTGLPQIQNPANAVTQMVDTAAILRESDEDELADPDEQGHTFGGRLPGQEPLTADERSLLG
jgi:hypothetical protein